MIELAYITQGTSQYDDRLWEILDGSGIDPHEFVGLDYFSLAPFFVLAGATVAPEAHAHDDHLHVTGVRITIAEELEEGFFAAIPEILADAYGDEDDEDDELGGDVSLN
jgi:hypothetical protein